ncbi:MAG: LysR family transcriptional regulator [Myxococcales bacterium]|nr:LysR family transcriptional regulator [Myxococcales bacterium]
MDLNEIFVFTKVVQNGSFVGASRDLGMPKSTVSRKVAQLEERLGARLLQRTTRRLSLTDMGHAFYRHASRVVEEAEEAERVVDRMQEVPRGALRVTAPLNFGFLGPIVASFLERYPEVELELVCGDRLVDLVEEGFDLAVRAGRLADSSLVARHLGEMSSHVVAAPAFLDRHGRPEAPHELERLAAVFFGGGGTRRAWTLLGEGRNVTVTVQARFTVNDYDFLDEAVLAGVGIAMLPIFRCADHLRGGRLERLLPAWCSPATPLHAVYPTARHLSPTVRAFLDHLRDRLTPPPWEQGAREAP